VAGPVPVEILVKVAEEIQDVRDLHPAVEIGPLRQIGHDLLCLRSRRGAIDGNGAGGGGKKAVQQLDQRRLAASVGAQKTDDAPALQGQVDAVESCLVA